MNVISQECIELNPALSSSTYDKLSSFTVLLLHEVQSFNRMLLALRQGLDSCRKAITGQHVMSEYVDNIVSSISSDIVMDEIKVTNLEGKSDNQILEFCKIMVRATNGNIKLVQRYILK
jgi:hypothetical protein